MAVAKTELMERVEYYQHLDRGADRTANGPTIAVNGAVYGSLNHPSSKMRRLPGVAIGKRQNLKDIIHTLDKAKATQEKLRRQKEKYESFIVQPMMGRRVAEVPGINVNEARRLQHQGIRSATDLREIYLDIGEKEFIEWMEGLGVDKAAAKECGQAIRDWCMNYLKLPR